MIPRTSIEEANRHLNLLHGRVSDLEKTVNNQHEALKAKDEHLQTKVAEISSAKNAEIESLLRKLRESEQTVVILQHQIQQKDKEIEKLQHNSRLAENLLNHKVSVQNLLQAMKEAEKNIREVSANPDSSVQGFVQPNDMQLNGLNGTLSSPEAHHDKKSETVGKSGDRRSQGKSKTKRAGGKEFYL